MKDMWRKWMHRDQQNGPERSSEGPTAPIVKRRILFVEDMEFQMFGMVSLLEATDEWEAEVVRSSHRAYLKLEALSQREDPLPDVVSIDLGLADRPDDPDYGLNLLVKIRQRWEGLPLVIHSSRVEVTEDVVRQVLAQSASYIFLGDKDNLDAYVTMLPYVAQGYVVFSPSPAGRLPLVVSVKPDPFAKNPEYWETLRLLNEGKTYGEIASAQNVTDRAIMARVKRMAFILHAIGEIELPDEDDNSPSERYRPRVIPWYRANRFRYHH